MELAYSLRTLEETPRRALSFITGLRDKAIRKATTKAGLSDALLDVGRQRLMAVIGGEAPEMDAPAINIEPGFAEVITWDERNFAVLEAAIAFYVPAGAAWVFSGLSPQDDHAGSIQAVATALRRVEMLLQGHPEAPAAPVELAPGLEQLGFGAAERQRLLGLVVRALTPAQAPDDEEDDGAAAPPSAAYLAALVELRRWYDLASAIARRSGLKRYQLIRVGLAQRKKATSTDSSDDPSDAPAL
jgi:hypothetical protein